MSSRVRIISGEHRSRFLETPAGHDVTRPMTSRVKESLFDILRGWFDGTTVVDLFAGAGTLGLEALSRGAARVVLVERDHDVYKCLERNIAALHAKDRCTALQADALSATTLARMPTPVDVIFMDPPYDLA
ncbi:MAG: 16S rRNA (guanine(966)-N(2))-methyltransferase RsmD, partial [Phycisphaerae bacterium]|nr:16S rRNA (guanine(966)-N(2))-methyltransferase RsmD [Phycisphaerae bacterium]